MAIGGVLTEIRRTTTRRNEQMAYVRIEDMVESFECVVFPRLLEEYRHLFQGDAMLVVKGQINTKEDDDNVMILQEVLPLEAGAATKARAASSVKKDRNPNAGRRPIADPAPQAKNIKPGFYLRCGQRELEDVIGTLQAYPGNTPLVFAIDGKPYRDQRLMNCQADAKAVKEMQNLLGEENVKLVF